MEIALLSGAYKNAGDFLIENRCLQLVQDSYPEANVTVFLRKNISKDIERINKANVAIFTGGPIYQSDISSNFPVDVANKIKPKTVIIGGGSWLNTNCKSLVYDYKFSTNTYKLFKRIDNDGGLGCRDLFAYKVLKNNGFVSPIMTGCPAWYDLRYVNCTRLINSRKKIKKICVSDPADPSNRYLLLELVNYLYEKYPDAEIKVIFHRGIIEDLSSGLQNACPNVSIQDISHNLHGFDLYDGCDLHIGFRVHAHIYNLSQRQRTLLIEEDSRGAGVNEALGLPSITAYNDEFVTGNRIINKYGAMVKGRKNRNLIKEIDVYLDRMRQLDDAPMENAFVLMNKYYLVMKDYIKKITK